MKPIDILVIGGGINGVGIAADAAGRGLNVVLCESKDLANATSSKSSKLIHGGLRYLEQYEFRLVREALQEREILLKNAPHLIHPLSFVMPYNPQLKPAWMMKIGFFLYDHLSKRKQLPTSYSVNLQKHSAGKFLKENYQLGFVYADCWTDDARLVVTNALQAQKLGATILTRTECINAQRKKDHWQVELKNVVSGEITLLQTKVLINATGPWVEKTLQDKLHVTAQNHISLVKGSHIIVPKLYAEDFAFIFLNTDNRVIFVTPYQDKYHLIGTTDIQYDKDPYAAEISIEEIHYLCTAVNRYFKNPISTADVISSYAGVRPLHSAKNCKNPSAVSRDYALELNTDMDQAPLLSVFGGKITTYRKLAEHALANLKAFFPQMGPTWTENSPLPGGNIATNNFSEFCEQLQEKYPWLTTSVLQRYAKSYGTQTEQLLSNINSITDLGQHFGAGLYAREAEYLCAFEWAQTAEDILWRRSKLGLFLTTEQIKIFSEWLQKHRI